MINFPVKGVNVCSKKKNGRKEKGRQIGSNLFFNDLTL